MSAARCPIARVAAMAATIRFNGPNTFEAHADASGAFSAVLPAGPYRVSVEATGYPRRDVPLDVARRARTSSWT